jgi:hypothetical protein
VHDTLLEREGGAGEDVFDGARGVSLPRDARLVVLGDVEDVGVELDLFDVALVGEDGQPLPVAQAVGGCLGLGVPGNVGTVSSPKTCKRACI